MITDVPTKDDFRLTGLSYVNLAWGGVIELLLGLDESIDHGWIENDSESIEEYWKASQQTLATSLTLLQQGIEFLLKSQIVEVSPFLLISNSYREWPSGANNKNKKFSDFKTLDAQDLIKIRDAVAEEKLPQSFSETFEKLRTQRNTIMHSVDSSKEFSPGDLLLDILEICQVLERNISWIEIRSEFIKKEPSFLKHNASEIPILANEMLFLAEYLKPKHLKKYLNINKRQRLYICNNCQYESREWELEVKLAQLNPNTPTSTQIYCPVCRGNYTVDRIKCSNNGCKGNVIDGAEGICLTCLEEN